MDSRSLKSQNLVSAIVEIIAKGKIIELIFAQSEKEASGSERKVRSQQTSLN